MKLLDQQMENMSPGWVAKNAEADSNWAAKLRIKKLEDYNETDKALASYDKNAKRAKGYTKEELALIKRAGTGGTLGTVLNTFGAALNPAHGGLAPLITAGVHLPTAIMTGGASIPFQLAGMAAGYGADLGAKALRNKAYNQAMEQLGSRSTLGRMHQLEQQITTPVQPLSVFRGAGYAAPGILADPSQRQLLLGGGS